MLFPLIPRSRHRLSFGGLLTGLLLSISSVTLAQSSDTLPTDPAVKIGTLPNGMRYYIRTNKKPEKRVEFRLAVRAGSLMEDDSQRGLAHWAEHMAFNGTANFKKNDVIDYLRSIGVRFGADLNAYTNFGETVYILPVPTDTLAQVKQALQILEDWAHQVTFAPEDFEAERGVILSERRSGLGVGSRLTDLQMPVIFKGSRYADRSPIGTKESLEQAKREDILRFYKEWYRPDLMAIIAVGDFDAREMEQMIREQFSRIPAAIGPTPRPVYPVPPQPGTSILVARDPEMTATQLSVSYKGPAFATRTQAAYRDDLRRSLFTQMLNRRYQEILQVPNAPFVQAGIGFDNLAKDASIVSLSAMVADNEVQRGLDALLTEVVRVVRYGFTASELESAKRTLQASIDHYYQNRNDRESGEFAGQYIAHFLTDDEIPDAEAYVNQSRKSLAEITLAEVNGEAAFWQRTDNRVLFVVQPEKTGIQAPDTTALLAAFSRIAAQPVAAYEDKTTTGALLERLPVPGKVVAEKQHPEVGVTEWTLSNGAVVFLKPTKFKASEILFSGTSPGGTSLLADSLYPTAAFTQIVGAGGWGRFSTANLNRQMSGKIVNVSAGIGSTTEGISGYTNEKDLETMLQMVNLVMLDPRYDSTAIAAAMQRMKISLANRSASPEAAFEDTIVTTLTRGSPRSPLPSREVLDRVNASTAYALYKDRFADASDFAFIFVGAFNPDSLKPLVEQYLASLPALHRKEKARDLPMFHPPAGVIRKTVVAGREDRTVTLMNFSGSSKGATRQDRTDLSIMAEILEFRLVKRLREELGGTYGVSVGQSVDLDPVNAYEVRIQFVAEAARREELTKAVFAAIDSLKRIPPNADEIHRAVETSLRAREKARRTNEFWLGLLEMYRYKAPFSNLLDDTVLASITPQRVQKAAQRFINIKEYQEFHLVPAQ